MNNESLWRQLEEDYAVEKRWTLREVGIGLIAGGLFTIVAGWLYFVTVIAR